MSYATTQTLNRLELAIAEIDLGDLPAAKKQIQIVLALVESERDVEMRAQRVKGGV